MLQGKEALLNAIGSLSKSSHKAISSDDPAVPNAILSVVLERQENLMDLLITSLSPGFPWTGSLSAVNVSDGECGSHE